MEENLVNIIGLLKNTKTGNKETIRLLHLDQGFEYKPPRPVIIEDKDILKDDLCSLF